MALSFFQGKKILITGHTGFKGSWLSMSLLHYGAEPFGYALEPPTEPSLFHMCGLDREMQSVCGDVRDLEHMRKVFDEVKPEYVIHLAAQPIVRESYHNPVYTYDVNVMGTVHFLECVRQTDSVLSVVNVTTDKVYKNRDWEWGYRENEELNGYDPYSNSKSCSELVTSSYRNSFFSDRKIAVSTARAGNVIGGGDFAIDRIVPDCVRAALAGNRMIIRNPDSIRPYQHVLEPVMAYLMLLEKQAEDPSLSGNYNIGPESDDCRTTGEIAKLFAKAWEKKTGEKMALEVQITGGPKEANILKLDCSRAKSVLGWHPAWNLEKAVEETAAFSALYRSVKGDENSMSLIRDEMIREIEEYRKTYSGKR